jgi:hypothetical protein
MSDALDTKSPWSSLSQPKSASQYYAKQMLDKPPEERQKYAQELAYDQLSLAPLSGEAISAKEAKDYFEEGRTGMGMLATAGAIPLVSPFIRPITKSVGSLMNKTAMNTPTLIPEFYTNPIKGKFNFLKEFGGSFVPAIKESIDPIEVARRRETGMSKKKLEEGLISKEGKDAELTGASINRQVTPDADNAVERSVIGLTYLDSQIPLEDTARIASGIGSGFRRTNAEEVPESIVQRATNHLTKGPHVKSGSKTQYDVQIKDPHNKSNEGFIESVGDASAGSTIVRMMRGNSKEDYLKLINNYRKANKLEPVENLSGKDMVEYMQISSTLDNTNIRLLQQAGVTGQPAQIVSKVLAARAKQAAGKPFTSKDKQQKKALDTFNSLLNKRIIKFAQVKDEAGNLVSSRNVGDIKQPDGYVVSQQAFTSRQKELGGMNAFVVVDPNSEKMYTMISDGHDIMGVNPVGGKGLITAEPIIVSSIKPKGGYKKSDIKSRATQANVNEALSDTEKLTGIKPLKDESDLNYTLRALSTYKPAVTAADRARARNAKLKLGGTLGTGGLLTGAVLRDDE